MIVLGVDEQAGKPNKTSPDPGEAFVIFDGRSRAIVLQTGERLSPAEIRNWGKRKVVRVLAAKQSTPIQEVVHAADGFRTFTVSLTVTWQVSDFVRAAQGGSLDILAALRSAVQDKIGDLDRQCEMTPEGADELYRRLRESLELTVVEFITVERVSGRVILDESTSVHRADVSKARDDHELERTRVANDTELERLRKDKALLEEETKVAVERMRQTFQLEMVQQKLNLYGKLSGMAGLVSLQLANDPSQVNVVIQNARNHELVTARLQLDAVTALVEADAVEGFQLQDVAKRSLERFLQLASGGIPEAPPQPPEATIEPVAVLSSTTDVVVEAEVVRDDPQEEKSAPGADR